MRILVTGAAGYIGSVLTEHLLDRGHDVVGLDDLRHGHRRAVDDRALFVQADLCEADRLNEIFAEQAPDAVAHLAAEALIDTSLRDPGTFYRTNVCGGLNLLEAMTGANVHTIVFSSTAAVYGESETFPIEEGAPQAPVNAYGETKLDFERMLEWYRVAHDVNYVVFRYFNACGATAARGEDHSPETHLIPSVLDAAAGRRGTVDLFGTDYDTPDGTCIRDYVHVSDIAEAHRLALECGAGPSRVYNIGNGVGHSNRQVIDTVQNVTGREVAVVPRERRPGDPGRLVASSGRIREELGWKPRYPRLIDMVQSAWDWRSLHPGGYR